MQHACLKSYGDLCLRWWPWFVVVLGVTKPSGLAAIFWSLNQNNAAAGKIRCFGENGASPDRGRGSSRQHQRTASPHWECLGRLPRNVGRAAEFQWGPNPTDCRPAAKDEGKSSQEPYERLGLYWSCILEELRFWRLNTQGKAIHSDLHSGFYYPLYRGIMLCTKMNELQEIFMVKQHVTLFK